MPLYDDPPHTCTSFSAASSRDAGGGTTLTYTQAQQNIPCSISTASASTVEMFKQAQIAVSHTIAMLTAAITTPITRGFKVTDSGGKSYKVEGIQSGQEYGNVPPLTYLHCQQLL